LGLDNGDGSGVAFGSGQDSDAITDWVNDGVLQTLMDTSCYVTTATLTPGASGADFVLTSSVLEIMDLTSSASNSVYGMERVSPAQILELRRTANAASSPTTYYALAGQNLLMFYPSPGTTDTFTLYYVPVPTVLSTASDDPSAANFGGVPTEFHKAIEFYACSEAADVNDDESSTQGQKYFLLYQDQVKKIRRVLRRRGGSTMPLAKVGPRNRGGHRNAFHNNSVY
jgi:hypothetical protein